MSTITPANVRELKIEIGKDILRSSLKAMGTEHSQTDAIVKRSNDAYHIDAAENLRSAAPAGIMSGIAQIADRALREFGRDTGDALMSIMSDLTSNFRYVNQWFIHDSPPFFTNLFRQLAEMDEEQMRNTLQVLAAYARGE